MDARTMPSCARHAGPCRVKLDVQRCDISQAAARATCLNLAGCRAGEERVRRDREAEHVAEMRVKRADAAERVEVPDLHRQLRPRVFERTRTAPP